MNKHTYNVLLVDDDEDDYTFFRDAYYRQNNFKQPTRVNFILQF